MPIKTVEAQLVLGGKDGGASAAVNALVKSFEQAEKAGAGVSKSTAQVARTLLEVEKAQRAVDSVMSAQRGVVSAEANLAKLRTGATTAAAALDKARTSHQAFEGVKATKGSELAAQMNAAAKAVAAAEKAQKSATREVAQATKAHEQQARALRDAERAAAAANVPLAALEQHQRTLAVTYDRTTEAMRRQIRVEGEAARMAQHHAREQAEAAKHMRRHGVVGAAGALASGAVGIHGVTHTIGESLKAGAEVQSNRVDMAKAGIGFSERQHITDESLRLAATYKNVTQASVMELWKEMRSVMTDPHEVDHIIDPMVRAKSLLDAKDKTGTASHGLNLLVKGAEAIGAAKDPERFTKLLDSYIKAMQVMGSTVTPEGIYEMQKYSKTSGGRWSDRFIMTTAQSLGQELSGSTAGNSIDVATRQIVGGMQNLHSKAKEFARVGLIDKNNLDILKNGEVKGVKAGVKHAVKGDDLAASDLDLWVYHVLLPHLQKAGIKSEKDQMAWVQKNFTGTGANVVAKLIQQRESFEAHGRMYGEASGLDGTKYNRSDPTAAFGAVTKSLETFLGVVSSPIMVQAAHGLDDIATAVSGWSMKLDAFNKAHPDLAKWEAPVAAGAGLAGAGAASALAYKALTSGFGLPAAAGELTIAAKALDAAAVKLASGKGGIPDLPGKTESGGGIGSKIKSVLPYFLGAGAVLGGTAGIGYVLSEYGDPSKSVNGTGGRPDDKLTLNPSDELPGLSGSSDAPSWAPKAQETGKAIGTEIGKAIADAPLPPRRPAMLEDFKQKADESGTAAGKTILQRLMEAVSIGLEIPIRFTPGEGSGGGSLVQKASFSTGGEGLGGFSGGSGYAGTPVGGGGGIVRASPGIGGGVGRVGSVRGISARDMRDVHPEMAAYIRAAALANGIDPNVALRIANSEGLRGSIPGVRNTPGDKGTSFGPFQLHYASRIPGLRNGGLGDRYTRETGHHASDPKYWKEQIDFALRTARREGWGAWHGRYGAGIGLRDGIGTVRPVPMSEQARQSGGDGEPRLVKGLDGKEGLDLGDGTMKMPDGSIRSITSGAPRSIPAAPQAGAGIGGMGEHVAELGRHIDKLADAQMRVHATFEVNAGSGLTARAKKIRSHSDGPVRGNVGVSMPGAEGGVIV